jgi:predicted metalloprotease with PDZ domain
MRGVNLNLFDFDYDLTWAAFFMNGSEKVYGRFGGRDASSPDAYLTLAGLKYAMRQAVEAHRREPKPRLAKETQPARTVEQYPAAKPLKADACIHCHEVYSFRRAELRNAGKWTLDQVWVYPVPANIGLTLDPDQGNRVTSVKAGSAAERAGVREGDELESLNGQSVASFADVEYALHRAPARGTIRLSWRQQSKLRTADVDLPEGWRTSDISWRASMWGLEPSACVHGPDLSPREKKALGLTEKSLAFRQGDFVPAPAKMAGIRAGDIILGFEDKRLEMTMVQFNAYVRLNFKPGNRITFNVMRDGKKLDVPMTLPKGEH